MQNSVSDCKRSQGRDSTKRFTVAVRNIVCHTVCPPPCDMLSTCKHIGNNLQAAPNSSPSKHYDHHTHRTTVEVQIFRLELTFAMFARGHEITKVCTRLKFFFPNVRGDRRRPKTKFST